MTKKLKAGIIGLGRIASLYELDKKAQRYYPYLTHAGTYAKHPRVALAYGADNDRSRLDRFRKMWGLKDVYADYKKMLKEEKIDILSICTPPDKHYEIIREAAGCVKTIFCEKPFTRNSDEIRKIIKLAKKTRTKITVNLYREYDKSHLAVRNLIKSGRYGRVQRVNCFYGKGLRNMGTHILAYLLGTFEVPIRLKVLKKKRFQGIDEYTYDVYLEFKKGIPAVMQGCDFSKFRVFEMDFICEKGRVQILDEGLSIKIFKVSSNRAETGACELVETDNFKNSVGRAFYYAADHLVRLSVDKKAKPMVSPEKYLKLQLLIEEIERQGRGL